MNMNNHAFIDAQNLYLGTTTCASPWRIDFARFRVYLKNKYGVEKAYYFFGVYDAKYQAMYNAIKHSGYILHFRKHNEKILSNKKGNVDTDIIFEIMRALYKQEDFEKVLLVSGDGDYWRLVDFLISENRFGKLLIPGRQGMSSLYKKTPDVFRDFLDNAQVKQKIALIA